MKFGKYVIGLLNMCILGLIVFNFEGIKVPVIYIIGTVMGVLFAGEFFKDDEKENEYFK